MKSSHFANDTQSSRHDYCFSPMSPALSTIFSHDNHSQHLFGDLVSSSDFRETFDNQSSDGPALSTRQDYSMHECNNNRMFTNDSKPIRNAFHHDGHRHNDKCLVSSSDSDQLRANSDLFEWVLRYNSIEIGCMRPVQSFQALQLIFFSCIQRNFNTNRSEATLPRWASQIPWHHIWNV